MRFVLQIVQWKIFDCQKKISLKRNWIEAFRVSEYWKNIMHRMIIYKGGYMYVQDRNLSFLYWNATASRNENSSVRLLASWYLFTSHGDKNYLKNRLPLEAVNILSCDNTVHNQAFSYGVALMAMRTRIVFIFNIKSYRQIANRLNNKNYCPGQSNSFKR